MIGHVIGYRHFTDGSAARTGPSPCGPLHFLSCFLSANPAKFFEIIQTTRTVTVKSLFKKAELKSLLWRNAIVRLQFVLATRNRTGVRSALTRWVGVSDIPT